jgi:hypothetical protein
LRGIDAEMEEAMIVGGKPVFVFFLIDLAKALSDRPSQTS